MIPLPIDHVLSEIVARLKEHRAVVVEAPPGAGKTTRVPRALLDHGFADKGEILVLEPRRLATRMSARRVAEELGEKTGERVGYQVRFEDVTSPKTKVRFMTEGLLTRRFLSKPTLQGVSVVVLDEFHERHIHTDLALALVKRLQATERPDLKLVVMSATLDGAAVAGYLGDAPVVRSEGKRFEVDIVHAPRPDDRPLHVQVAQAVRQASKDGDVLVFLPGAAEIRKAQDALQSQSDFDVATLHGDLSPDEQDRAVRSGGRRKVILSTNVAETSVTIEGVTTVVDSGLARIASHAAWSGLSLLKVSRIAQAAAKQRAGRAGRVRAGQCIRLYTQHDYATRPQYELPELLRLDLSETALLVRTLGHRLEAIDFFEKPLPQAIDAGERLLERLGAVDAGGTLTEIGKRMAKVPAHPRLARLLIEGEARGVTSEAATLAAMLSEREVLRGAADSRSAHESDPLVWLDAFQRAERENFSSRIVQAIGLDVGAVRAVKRQRDQLAKSFKDAAPAKDKETALQMALLAAYPDRLARRRKSGGREVIFAAGGSGELGEQSVVKHAEWMIAVDAEERVSGAQRKTIVRAASEVAIDWLLELFIDRVSDKSEATWNAEKERVESTRRMRYDGFVIDEGPDTAPDAEVIADVLFQAAKARGLSIILPERDELDRLIARVAFLRKACPELELPAVDEALLDATLKALCLGKKSFAELRDADPIAAITYALGPNAAHALQDHAPDRVQLPGGRKAPIDYPLGEPPHVSSRLQDFFGMKDGPKLAKGRVPLVMHLLAPNGRDVQVTTDLAGFWQRHYPAIAKELRRRYPRHSWPDDPLTAAPPAPAGRRR
ncbi:MAG: ATP-dependent helicase HrpB [Deltaproteobacteria bacterium]|nr:ATP-dependent helicase HrpB [Deltaproteobacteria bacterium]